MASDLAAFALNGVVLGSILALAAVGLSLVYGILRLSNFAHGDILTAGAYVVFAANTGNGPWPWFVAGGLAAWLVADRVRPHLHGHERAFVAAAALLIAGLSLVPNLAAGTLGPRFLLGLATAIVIVPAGLVALDRLVWQRLRAQRAGQVTFIITSIGVALALRHALMIGFGPQLHAYDQPLKQPLSAGPFTITQVQIWTVIAASIAILGVHVLLKYTRTGRSLRAVADNMELARVTGIDVPRMITYVWILAGILAALAGTLLAMNVNVNPNLGWNLLLPIFAAVILGGIGSAYGALLGALVIGVVMEVSVAWWPEYRIATAFAVLIGVMLLRPQGILGVKTR